MSGVIEMLVRQSAWQRQRSQLPWPEKLRQAAAARDAMGLKSPAEPELKHDASIHALIRRYRQSRSV